MGARSGFDEFVVVRSIHEYGSWWFSIIVTWFEYVMVRILYLRRIFNQSQNLI